MSIERQILDRLTALEYEAKDCHRNLAEANARIAAQKLEIDELNVWRTYCDKMALRWGGFLMGVLAIGALLSLGFDKVRDKVLAWFFQ